MKKALIVLDLINDIVEKEGKVGIDGFYSEAMRRNIIHNTKSAIESFRENNFPIVFVVVGFSDDYSELSPNMKIFDKVKKNQQVILNTWGTMIHSELTPLENEYVVEKNKISAFLNTGLEEKLSSLNIDELYLAGVASDLVVLDTCFEAHDRGYKTVVLEDCICSIDSKSHNCAMHIIGKLAKVKKISDLM